MTGPGTYKGVCHVELEDDMGCRARKGRGRKGSQSTSVDPHGLKNSCPRSWNHLLETVNRKKVCYNPVGSAAEMSDSFMMNPAMGLGTQT